MSTKGKGQKVASDAQDVEEEKKESVKSSSKDFPDFENFVGDLGSWKKPLQKVLESKDFKSTYEFIKTEYASKKVYPPVGMIFNAFKLTPIEKVKAVVVGQDPYHGAGQAMGLCFSVPKSVKTPPSLNNMYKCMQTDPAMSDYKNPGHGDLTKWAKEGVFLINVLLTVVEATPMSHKGKWELLTDAAIKAISDNCDGVVFLLWGAPAQAKKKLIDTKKHFVLETTHPSPLSAAKGFLTSKCFSEANAILKKNGRAPIDWSL